MSATGIGAPVRRTEDFRFITGKGQYTDDINRAGQAHAYFLRSPHAHAEIVKIDASKAQAADGVLAVLTGADLAADNIGGLICGWKVHCARRSSSILRTSRSRRARRTSSWSSKRRGTSLVCDMLWWWWGWMDVVRSDCGEGGKT